MPTREIFWNITRTGEVVLYTAAAAAVAILILGLRRRLRHILAGRKTPCPGALFGRPLSGPRSRSPPTAASLKTIPSGERFTS